MMFSSDMLLAASFDGLSDALFYATAASAFDIDCGKCYQVKPLEAEKQWNDSLANRQLIIQTTNTGADVMVGQFDIFIGAGGLGMYNRCSRDCKEHYCQGGPCMAYLYEGTFDQWNPEPWGNVVEC